MAIIVPNYSAFRKRNRRLFNRELLRQARRRLATSSILAIVWPHVYATQSTGSGATWSPNVRMTSAQSNFDGNDNGPGDYSSSTPFNSTVWPFFSDHRNANPQTASGGGLDVYTVNVQ
jgi:type II secretory pathway pseudopilin PulG